MIHLGVYLTYPPESEMCRCQWGDQAGGLSCADPGARTPIGARGIITFLKPYQINVLLTEEMVEAQ